MHTVEATVEDTLQSITLTDAYYVTDPSDTTPPSVHLTSPGDDVDVTKPTDIRGDVFDARLSKWTT